ncbi:hypothetical protein JXQ31_17350 [candidate division KSB1 bacterium]|nr:hypothetical protein [candidate division KSB1 bacterium]
MSPIELTQTEADRLMSLEKHTLDQRPWSFPDFGGKISIPLTTTDKRENFYLDIGRGKIKLNRTSYQNRALVVVPLLRLDYDGPPHMNPDGQEIPCPHLHIYKEEYGDRWAYKLPQNSFRVTNNILIILDDFMKYCHIITRPNIIYGLFT